MNQEQATAPAPATSDANRVEHPGTTPLLSRSAQYVADMAANLRYAQDFAKVLKAASVIPEHLRTRRVDGKVIACDDEEIEANLVIVCNQAIRWEVDPFALMAETYVLNGVLSYQGKIVAAVVNRDLEHRLTPVYSGQGAKLKCTLRGSLKGEEPRQIVVEWDKAKTYDKDGNIKENWRKKPEQQLYYYGAREWARRHYPEILMGIMSDDESGSEELTNELTPAADVIERAKVRMSEAVHKGQVQKALLDALFEPNLAKVEKRVLMEIAKTASRELPSVEKWLELDVDDDPEPEPAAEPAFDSDGLPAGKVYETYISRLKNCSGKEAAKAILEESRNDENVSDEQFQEVELVFEGLSR